MTDDLNSIGRLFQTTQGKLPRKAQKIYCDALSRAFGETVVKRIQSSKESSLSVIAVALQNRGADIFDEIRGRSEISNEIREILGSAGLHSVFVSALGSARPVFKRGFADAICAGLGVFDTEEQREVKNPEALLAAQAYAGAVARLAEKLHAISESQVRAELFEACGQVAMLAARIGKFETVSAAAREHGALRSSAGRSKKTARANERREIIKEAVFKQLEADPNQSDGKIAVMVTRDFGSLYKQTTGNDNWEKTPKRDVAALRKEWIGRS